MKFPLIIVLILISCTLRAQYFKPDAQVSGYLDSKNTMVDHSTGTFNYTIPLYEITSGSFKLPVQLSYAGKGVQADSDPGIIGHNWSLVAGGVISKMVRSDGAQLEKDLYVASFNGRSIHFLMQDNKAVPLEKTNVKIQYNENDSWVLTDENGIKYSFNAREITRNAFHEDPLFSNNIDNLEYTSAWYISKISIPNSDPIYFEYSPSYDPEHDYSSLPNFHEHLSAEKYFYGLPMTEWSFNFSARRNEFQDLINKAYEHAHDAYLSSTVNNYITYIGVQGEILENPAYWARIEAGKVQGKLLGILTELKEIPLVTADLFSLLNDLIARYNSYQNYNTVFFLRQAKFVLNEVVRETSSFSSQIVNRKTQYTVMQVLLYKIICRNQELIFSYHTDKMLKNIDLSNYKEEKIGGIKFESTHLLKKITWSDKNNNAVKNYKFSYFYEDYNPWYYDPWTYNGSSWNYTTDPWGYYSKLPQILNDTSIIWPPDEQYAKCRSLQKITISEGGGIEFDYELNRLGENNTVFGGLRLKNILFKDGMGNNDTIRYHYPGSGRLVYDSWNTYERINYSSGITDKVLKTRVDYNGNALINTGNNGIFYDYIIEEFVRKGCNTYLFCIPQSSSNQIDNAFPFWLCRLRLAQGVYDKEGNLIKLQKMKYYTDLRFCHINVTAGDWFEQSNEDFNYSQCIGQARMSKYYVKPSIESYYRNMEKIPLYVNDPDLGTLYYDPMNEYELNILPRVNYNDGWYGLEYNLYYGGKTLLKEMTEYTFNGGISSSPSKSHLTGSLPSNQCMPEKITFTYDNALMPAPTRVIRSQSNGDELVTVKRTPVDFADGVNAVIDAMRDSNFISPAIKELVLVKKQGSQNYILLSEKTTLYDAKLLADGSSVFLPRNVLGYSGATLQIGESRLSEPDYSLYTADSQDYRSELQMTYRMKNGQYQLNSLATPEKYDVLVQEKEQKHIILNMQNEQPDFVDAIDVHRWGIVNYNLVQSTISYADKYDDLIACHTTLEEIYDDRNGLGIKEYAESESFYALRSFISAIVQQERYEKVEHWQGAVHLFARRDFINTCDTSRWLCVNIPQAYNVISAIDSFSEIPGKVYSLLHKVINGELEPAPLFEELNVSVDNNHKSFDLVVLLKPERSTFSLQYKIDRSGQLTETRTETLNVTPGVWQLVSFKIDTEALSGVTALKAVVPMQGEGISLALLVPKCAVYEAMAYTADGNELCRFNQNGLMTINEYDAAGRISKVFDRNGNLVKENKYVFSINNE